MKALCDLLDASNGMFACCGSIIIALAVALLAGAAMVNEWEECPRSDGGGGGIDNV